jgi:hypothetical protein
MPEITLCKVLWMLLYVSRLLNELDVSYVECEFDDIFVMCELNLI